MFIIAGYRGIFERRETWVKEVESYLGGGYDTFYRTLVFLTVLDAQLHIEHKCKKAAAIAANSEAKVIRTVSCD